MKLPYLDIEECRRLKAIWQGAADQISLEEGVFISIGCEFDDKFFPILKRIFFKLDEREFESLRDVRRALSLKAFL